MNIKGEQKIMGKNPILISSALVAAFTLAAVFGGDLLNLSCIGFEVIFPYFIAIAVGEWGKLRADENFDVIAAQGTSMFIWVVSRFTAIFLTINLFAAISMSIVFLIRNEMPLWELILTYISPAFFLASLCMLLNLCFSAEHITTLICGIVWLVTILTHSALLRIPGVEYVYLFIRYVGDQHGVWLLNKTLLIAFSLILWIIIYLLCKLRTQS